MDEKKQIHPILGRFLENPPPPGAGGVPPQLGIAPARQYEIDGKDRALLPLAVLLGVLLFEMVLNALTVPGLAVTAMVAAWYGVLFWYKGIEGLRSRPALLMLLAVCLQALTFVLFSSVWFRLWNLLTLPALLGVQLFQWSGAARRPWTSPGMLWERLCLTLDGLFCRLGAPLRAAVPRGEGRGRWVYVALGLAAAVPVLFFVFPLLVSADALFAQFTSGLVAFLNTNLREWMVKLAVGLCLAPFLFGLLYALRRPEPLKEKAAHPPLTVDAALPVTLLVVMDGLYAVFLAVQFAGLFGGDRYLAATGISYADYARSGFFQLVTVSVLNLALVMACLQVSKREGLGWGWVRALSTGLVGASVVMLASAAWKMTLYVTVYGLSFKRLLTYWGMVMLAIFFTAALAKIWREGFSFFKVFFAAGLAGWLVLNYMNIDLIVAKYNVSRYQSGAAAVMDLPYLAELSYDTLGVLEELPGDTQVYHGSTDYPLSRLVAERRDAARRDASHWQSWSLSAYLAARGQGEG